MIVCYFVSSCDFWCRICRIEIRAKNEVVYDDVGVGVNNGVNL